MAELGYVNSKGLVEFKETDVGQSLEAVPGPLEGLPLERLRFNGTAIVDAEQESTFFVDPNGDKYLVNDSPDAVTVTGTFDLNRRGGPNDAVQRASGSWIADGFQVGKFVSIEGSAGADLVYKVIAVTALDLEFDESVERIPSDEIGVSITVHQGWQRLEGLGFNDVMTQSADGIWRAQTNEENEDDSLAVFKLATEQLVSQHVTNEAPYPDRHQAPPEAMVASAKIVSEGKDQTPKWGYADLAQDTVNFGSKIYDQVAGTESVEVTFVAASKTITRAAGSFRDNFNEGMSLNVTGSASNDSDKFEIKDISGNGSTLELGNYGPNLTDEGPVTVTLDGLHTIEGYETRRNEAEPGFVSKDQWRRFMEEAVAQTWFARIETIRKDYVKNARTAAIWATTTAYAVDDYVFEPDSRLFYRCNTAHTATTFTADAANWDVYLPEGIQLPAYPTAQIES